MDSLMKFLPFIIALAGALTAIWKFIIDLPRGLQGSLREEYKFAREFLSDLKFQKDMHPFVREKGYQAVSGGAELSGAEIEYLLELHGSVQALRKFVSGRQYLEFYTTVADQKIRFKSKYVSPWSRNWRKSLHAILYFIFSSCAVGPLLLPVFKLLNSDKSFTALMITIPLFFPIAFLALKAAMRINNAESLVKNQVRYNSRRSLVPV